MHCYQCHQHRAASGGRVADTVVFVAYAIKGEQHYQNLIAYKAKNAAVGAQSRLRDLTLLFLHDHWRCLESAAGGPLERAGHRSEHQRTPRTASAGEAPGFPDPATEGHSDLEPCVPRRGPRLPQ